jgi:predicted nuclease of predicted toxin-antitoxin system
MTTPERLRFLVDNSLSPSIAEALRENGIDTVHVRDYGMAAASDSDILSRASAESRVVVAADTDFGDLLALSGEQGPSVVIFRGAGNRRPGRQALLLLANLDTMEKSLAAGAIVVLENNRIRIRDLPVGRD